MKTLYKKLLENFNAHFKTNHDFIVAMALFGDASGRRYFRLSRDKDLAVAMVLPEIKEAAEAGGNKDVKESFKKAASRLKSAGLDVPEILGEDENLLLLQDLGNKTLYNEVLENPLAKSKNYERAILELVKFKGVKTEAADSQFGLAQLKAEMDEFLREMPIFSGVKLNENKLRPHLYRLCEEVSELKTEIMHRDFQSKNIMISGNKFYLIDFQDLCKGPYPYDLVALLRDSYIEIETSRLNLYLKSYYSKQLSKEMEYSQFIKDFHLMTLQRKIKDSGRFCTIDRLRNNPDFCHYIPLTLKYVNHSLIEKNELEIKEELTPLFKRFGIG